MADKLTYAMTVCDPNVVAVTEYAGVCWPGYELDRVRETAKEVGVFGFWRVKSREGAVKFPKTA